MEKSFKDKEFKRPVPTPRVGPFPIPEEEKEGHPGFKWPGDWARKPIEFGRETTGMGEYDKKSGLPIVIPIIAGGHAGGYTLEKNI